MSPRLPQAVRMTMPQNQIIVKAGYDNKNERIDNQSTQLLYFGRFQNSDYGIGQRLRLTYAEMPYGNQIARRHRIIWFVLNFWSAKLSYQICNLRLIISVFEM